jgi:hypothetical protein
LVCSPAPVCQLKLIQSKTWSSPVWAWPPDQSSLAIIAVRMKEAARERTVVQAGSLDFTRRAAKTPQRTQEKRGRRGMRA